MKADDFTQVQLSEAGGVQSGHSWHVMGHFGEPIDKYDNRVVSLPQEGARRKVRDEIHRDVLPGPIRDW